VLGKDLPRDRIKDLLITYDLKALLQCSSKYAELSTPPAPNVGIPYQYD
jgi:hypothetical protein